MKFYSNVDECVKNVEEYEIEFNNVNYTLVLDFNTDSNDIITTIVTDFDAYQYSMERYLLGKKRKDSCDNNYYLFNICVDFYLCDYSNKKEISSKAFHFVEKKFNTKVVRIHY